MTLAAQNLSLALLGQRVLADVACEFAAGQVSAIVGPNGAGKSSLLSCLVGLRAPDDGIVTLDGANIARLSAQPRARAIGYLPQIQDVHWDIDVRTLVALGRFPHRHGFAGESTSDTAAIDAAMADMQVAQFADRPVSQLSGGERARVLMARVLAGQPLWILADEPLANLDIGHQLDLLKALRRAARDQGIGVVMVLHDLAHAMNYADHLVLLDKGRTVASGPAAAVLTRENIGLAYGVAVAWVQSSGGQFALGLER